MGLVGILSDKNIYHKKNNMFLFKARRQVRIEEHSQRGNDILQQKVSVYCWPFDNIISVIT